MLISKFRRSVRERMDLRDAAARVRGRRRKAGLDSLGQVRSIRMVRGNGIRQRAERGSRPRWTAVCAILLAVLLGGSASAVRAQNPEISLDLASLSPPIRSDAPMTLVWRIVSQSTAVLEGQLEITVGDAGRVLGHAVIDDVVISSGEQFLRTVLPPIESYNIHNGLDAHLEFRSRGKKLAAWDPRMPQAPGPSQRRQVVLVADPWQASLPTSVGRLFDQLRIETWNDNPSDRTLMTIPARSRPEDLPVDPLAYCGFDIVLLVEQGFAETKEGQLRSLLEWVAAGGSVCVAPGKISLRDYQVAFLNQAVRAPTDAPEFTVDGSGRLVDAPVTDGQQRSVWQKRYGLGRIGIVRGPLEAFVTAPGNASQQELRGLAAFLWKMRQDSLPAFLETGTFHVESAIPKDLTNPQEQLYGRYNQPTAFETLRPKELRLASVPLQSGDQLISRLMPEGLKVVPLPLVGLILVAYVALIGPGDWLVLGVLRKRKWTWITFPCVTVAVTLATIWLADWYMQVSDRRRTVTVLDLGVAGEIARRNQFEVLFQGSEREVTSECSRELFSDMSLQRFTTAGWQVAQQQLSRSQDQHWGGVEATIRGRVPGRYKVSQFLSQWTPQLNRRFAIRPSLEKAVNFDWEKFRDPAVYGPEKILTGEAKASLLRDIQQAFGAEAHVAACVHGKIEYLHRNFGFLQSGQVYGVDVYGNPMASPYAQPWNAQAVQPQGFLEDVSVNRLGGLFDVVSQVSPTGGKDFEDLALVDPSDREQWLLIVAVERGDDVEIYRKLYRAGD